MTLLAAFAMSALEPSAAAREPGALKLAPVFQDHMVIQRGMPAPVWGTAYPGDKVEVELAGRTASAEAGADGRWSARLPSLEAGGPYSLSVRAGSAALSLEDVLVGDVWLCSGQSNMEMGLGALKAGKKEAAKADDPELRLLIVGHAIQRGPSRALQGRWVRSEPGSVVTGGWSGFSAVGYFFGRRLRKDLKVPIGLIESSWGGTPAEAWVGEASLRELKDFDETLDALRDDGALKSARERAAAKTEEWYSDNDPGTKGHWEAPALDDSGWEALPVPSDWESHGHKGFDGVAWLRLAFDVKPDEAGRAAILSLGTIDDRDTTFLNGTLVGRKDGWDVPRHYVVSAGRLKAGRNVLAVRVLDTGGEGGLRGKPEDLHLRLSSGRLIPLSGTWRFKAASELKPSAPVPDGLEVCQNSPGLLSNGMIEPLVPLGIKGAIWYQGESNASRPLQYRRLLPALIRDWRGRWGQGDFPFYIVQLAAYMEARKEPADEEWPRLREAQWLAAGSVPNAGLVTAIDVGEAGDIHPQNKLAVGERLAALALRETYGRKDVVAHGPEFESLTVEGSRARLRFKHADGGLKTSDGGPLKGFAAAGPDRKFHWAKATIEGDDVVVTAPGTGSPAAVRYAWANNPVANLANGAGWPALPFRTDDWP